MTAGQTPLAQFPGSGEGLVVADLADIILRFRPFYHHVVEWIVDSSVQVRNPAVTPVNHNPECLTL